MKLAQESWALRQVVQRLVLLHHQWKMGDQIGARVEAEVATEEATGKRIGGQGVNQVPRSYSIPIIHRSRLHYKDAMEILHIRDDQHHGTRSKSFEHPEDPMEAAGEGLDSQTGAPERVDFLL